MQHLFNHHIPNICDYNSITLDKITRSSYVALFRLQNNHFECHTLEDIAKWFLRNKTALPNTRADVTNADIKRTIDFYYTIYPPPPPRTPKRQRTSIQIPAEYDDEGALTIPYGEYVTTRRRRR